MDKKLFKNIISSFSDPEINVDPPRRVTKLLPTAGNILSKVKQEIPLTQTDRIAYFDVSFDRYSYALASLLSSDISPKRVLDLGCAPGHLGIAMHMQGIEVYGIDLNTEWAKTYPSEEWLKKLNVQTCNIETSRLPFDDEFFDFVMFTEVLEHIAIRNPIEIIKELKRVVRKGGCIVLSTPNVCNISNILALLKGKNIFWDCSMFYGSLDRHNREFTPYEILNLFKEVGFSIVEFFMINSPCNWNSNVSGETYELLTSLNEKSHLLRNTNVVIAYR